MSSTEEARRQGQKNVNPWHISLLKFILVVTNIIVLILEVALAGIFFYLATADKTLLISGLGQNVYDVSIGAVIAGSVFVILFTIFGIVGAIRENRCFLLVYFCLMFIIVMGEVAAIALTADRIESVRGLIKYNLFNSIRLYNSSVTITQAWDLFQKEKRCCGMANPESPNSQPWKAYTQAKAFGNITTVPASCCTDTEHKEACMAGDEKYIYPTDCFEVLKELLSEHHSYILGVGLSCLIITAVTLFLTGAFIVLS